MNQSNNNPFGNLKTDGLEAARDVLGGGGAMETDVYNGVIKLAFAGVSSGGAHSMTVHVDCGGREYRETMYVTNKQGQNFYEKNGKKNPLPGFTTANDIALLATGHPLNEQEMEEKVVKLYDFDAKAEVPTKVQAVVSLHGQQISLGILKQVVDKNVKDGNGNYVPSGETRDENVIDKVFHAETGKTVSEYTAKVPTADFQGKWLAKNKGVTRDRTSGATGKVGAPGQKAANDSNGGKTASKSLFG